MPKTSERRLWRHKMLLLPLDVVSVVLNAAIQAEDNYHPIFNRLRNDLMISDDRSTAPAVIPKSVEKLWTQTLNAVQNDVGMWKSYQFVNPTFIKTSPSMPLPQYFHQDFHAAEECARSVMIILGRENRAFEYVRVQSKQGKDIKTNMKVYLHPGEVVSFPGHLVHRGCANLHSTPNYAFHVYLVPKILFKFYDMSKFLNMTVYDDPMYDKDSAEHLFQIRPTQNKGLGLFARKDFQIKRGATLCRYHCSHIIFKEHIYQDEFYIRRSKDTLYHIPYPHDSKEIMQQSWFHWAAYFVNDGTVSLAPSS